MNYNLFAITLILLISYGEADTKMKVRILPPDEDSLQSTRQVLGRLKDIINNEIHIKDSPQLQKIKKDTIKKFPKTSSLKIFKFENSKNYYCSFYVGTHQKNSGNFEKSLRTQNVNEASKLAKQEFEKYFIENKHEKKEFNFTKDIAKPFIKIGD